MSDMIDDFKHTLGIPNNDDSPPTVTSEFDPQNTAVSYVDLSADGKMRAATAHFTKGGVFADTDQAWKNYVSGAVDGLRRVLSTTPLPTVNEAERILGATRFRYNFSDFTFKSKHHIFVVLGSSLEFDDHHPFSFVPKVFLSDGATTRNNDKNKSFVNSRHIDGFLPGLSTAYIQNRYRKASGLGHADIGEGDRLYYTININVKIPAVTGPGVYIPIAIDPDTGNGMGPNP